MSTLFQLPCDCGHITNISPNDAGKKIDCDGCGAVLEVPGMREIRKLEPAEDSSKSSDEKSWNFEKGIYFSFGMGAIVIGLTVAIACFYIGYFRYPSTRPDIREGWTLTSESVPGQDVAVWAYAPEPAVGERSYEAVKFDPENNVWFFGESDREPVPREYFSKWGNSFYVAMEADVKQTSAEELWRFWYEVEPDEPLPEWKEPVYAFNSRYQTTYFSFGGIGVGIILAGVVLVVISVIKT